MMWPQRPTGQQYQSAPLPAALPAHAGRRSHPGLAATGVPSGYPPHTTANDDSSATGPSPAPQSGTKSKVRSDRKRAAHDKSLSQSVPTVRPKRRLTDKILSQKVRDLCVESEAYMDLLSLERKLDATIMRKRLEIQEALKRPMKIKRKLRIFISHTFTPAKPADSHEEETLPQWELRVEGRLLDDGTVKTESSQPKRKFSSFFKSLVIELDKNLYGPDNHLVEPPQYKLDPRLARILGIHTQSRPVIIAALWRYIKTHQLQDKREREWINCDKYLQNIFDRVRFKFSETPQLINQLLMPPDPIVINHTIAVGGSDTSKKTACYDIDVEVDDNLKQQMSTFLLNAHSAQELNNLDNKIHEAVDEINQLKTSREFFLEFSRDPQQFINNWLVSQSRDLKTITDVVGNPEAERKTKFFAQPWAREAVYRYFYAKLQEGRKELEHALNLRSGLHASSSSTK